jgi:hypothetical protein
MLSLNDKGTVNIGDLANITGTLNIQSYWSNSYLCWEITSTANFALTTLTIYMRTEFTISLSLIRKELK